MRLRAEAIVCSARAQGETGVLARVLTVDNGLIAGYVAGGRGRRLRPVVIPGNLVEARVNAPGDSRLPFLTLELLVSRAPWLGEPLIAAAIGWVTTLTAAALPERHPYPPLYTALSALLEAVCVAPSARGWLPALLDFEALMLRELGYGRPMAAIDRGDLPALLALFDRLGAALARDPLADRPAAPARTAARPLAMGPRDVMGARAMLRDRIARLA